MHPRLVVNALSTASWSLAQDLELYAELGVHTASWYLDKLPDEASVDRIKDTGIATLHVCARGVSLDDRSQWPDDRARLRRAIDIAADLGASWVCTTTGPGLGLGWDGAVAALGEALEPIRHPDVTIAIEQTLPVRVEVGFVHSLRDLVDVAEQLDLGVVVETNYCFAERDLATTLDRARPRLATVQVSDLVPPSTVIPDRAVPGDGVIPLAELAAMTSAPLEIEILGPRIEAEGYAPALRRSIDQMNRIAEMAPATRQ